MQTPGQMLELLLDRRDLTESQAVQLLEALTQPDLAPALSGALLAALRGKGVTPSELRGFANAMRSIARKPELPDALDAIDIVGTGGDGSGSLNLSTGAALLSAACGLAVVKHGNRSISSRSGSADLLEQLGFTMPLDELEAAKCFAATGFTFLFAPYFHPAMQALAPIRAALGVRTVFNLLGPLTNPAAPRFQVIGTYDAATAELVAEVIAGTTTGRAWVIHGAAGWDEATPIGPFLAFDVTRDQIHRHRIDPQEFGFAPCHPADLAGGDAAANLRAMRDVFSGRERGAHRAALLLQCALGLYIAGRATSIAAGIGIAESVIDSGQAARWLTRLEEFAIGSAAA